MHALNLNFLKYSFFILLFILSATPVLSAATLGPAEIFLDRTTTVNPTYNVFIPTGIATDNDGNVFVYDSTSFGSDVLRKYNASGDFLGADEVHSQFSVATPGGYLAHEPSSQWIYMLLTQGSMWEVDPATGVRRPVFNLASLSIDTSEIYDVATNRTVEFSGGLIVPPYTWGDFTLRSSGSRTDFFISGKAPAHVFIVRVRFENSAFISAKAIVFSRLTTAGNVNLNRGVAVSPSGVVLTTLPILTERGSGNIGVGPIDHPVPPNTDCAINGVNCFRPAPSPLETCRSVDGSACSVIVDGLIAFDVDFQPDEFTDPQVVLETIRTCTHLPCKVPVVLLDRPDQPNNPIFNPVDVPSLGMDSDSVGNFYIATGPVGSSECGFSASGALIVIPSTLNFMTCNQVGNGLINTSVDVALSPDGRRAYMSLANLGLVATFADKSCNSSSLSGEDVFENACLFVMQQYRDFFQREGDFEGVEQWRKQIDDGAFTRPEVINKFLNSAEFSGRVAPIVRLYFAYFLRVPDHQGLSNWLGAFQGGTSLKTISDAFAQSEEFNITYGSLSDGEFVALVYENVLKREPDNAGFDYWINQLESGMSRGEVMVGFSESAEYQSEVANSVLVTMIYVGMLQRSPDQGGFNSWKEQFDNGTSPVGVIDDFLNSLEYHNRFFP